jgi:hypothetical protein
VASPSGVDRALLSLAQHFHPGQRDGQKRKLVQKRRRRLEPSRVAVGVEGTMQFQS